MNNDAEKALDRLKEIDCAIRITKLSRATQLRDCKPALWYFLGLTKEPVYRLCPDDHFKRVGDLPVDVWLCEIGLSSRRRKVSAYGTSLAGAVQSATAAFFDLPD